MRCPHCNKDLGDKVHRFCPGCGKALPVPQPVTPVKQSTPKVPEWQDFIQQTEFKNTSIKETVENGNIKQKDTQITANKTDENTKDEFEKAVMGAVGAISKKVSKKNINKPIIPKNIVPDIILPCDGEKPIKQYVFSDLKMFQYCASGILQVTNKRIIYDLIGNSGSESERTHSEFSIDDVSGITVEKSSKIKISKIIPFILIGIVLFGIMQGLGRLIATIPYVGLFLCCIIGCLGCIICYKINEKNNFKLLHYVCALFGDITIGALLQSFDMSTSSGIEEIIFGISRVVLMILVVVLVIINICSYLSVLPQPIISIIITSKSGAATPINASSFSPKQALKSMCDVEPTEETDIMIRELGALVSDVQKQGDYAIAKWSK